MRQLHSTPKEGKPPRAKKEEPLEDGLVRSKKRPKRFWGKMNDDELVRYAEKSVRENKIASRKKLEEADSSLCSILRQRGLLNSVLASKYRSWPSMSDQELIEYAKTFVKENKISSRKDLEDADHGLFNSLYRRGLLDSVLASKYRRWASMPDQELIDYAKTFVKENKIDSRIEIRDADASFYITLVKRGLLERVLGLKRRDWESMPDQELIDYAKTFVNENKITSRSEIQRAQSGLYKALERKNLLDSVLPSKLRDWSSMPDQELLEHAKKFIEENKIASRRKLEKSDSGLYRILHLRRLMDAVFSDLEAQTRAEAVQGVLDELDKFGGSE